MKEKPVSVYFSCLSPPSSPHTQISWWCCIIVCSVSGPASHLIQAHTYTHTHTSEDLTLLSSNFLETYPKPTKLKLIIYPKMKWFTERWPAFSIKRRGRYSHFDYVNKRYNIGSRNAHMSQAQGRAVSTSFILRAAFTSLFTSQNCVNSLRKCKDEDKNSR